MSTPYALPDDPRLGFIGVLKYIMPTVSKGEPDWKNPEAPRDHVSYPLYSTAGLAEMNKLLAEMRSGLPNIHVPVFLAHSKKDTGVAPQNMERIAADLKTKMLQKLWLENSGHVIVREPEREVVFKAIAEFICQVNGAD